MSLQDDRKEYRANSLSDEAKTSNPIHLFEEWLESYRQTGVADATAFALSTVSAEGLKQLCNRNLAYYKIPSEIRFVKEVPLTITGKPQKFRMREIMLEEQKII